MAIKLTLHSIEGPFVAFNIDLDLWFMQIDPIPRIYDSDLKPQIVPNFDSWFQARTHQRYSFQAFKDVVDAFRLGLSKSYSTRDFQDLVARTTVATKTALMERMGEYGRYYWIEVLDPVQLETVWVGKIRAKFDELRKKLGNDKFHNYLCRLMKFATKHRPGLVTVFEKFIQRLGRNPAEQPKFPQTDDLDAELCRVVMAAVLNRHLATYRGVPEHVQERLEVLNGRR